MAINLRPVSKHLVTLGIIFFSQLHNDGLLESLELFIADLRNISSHFFKELIDALRQVMRRLHVGLYTDHKSTNSSELISSPNEFSSR